MIDIDLRRAVVPLALFFGTFAWSFVYLSLPFYIERLRPGGAVATLRWTGWILGVTPLVTVVMAPLWGRLAASRDPKVFYVRVQSIQGFAFLGMALVRSLPGLLALRLLQVLCVAPIFPIAVTGIVQRARGEAIGMVNGASIAAAFVGPVLATTILAWGWPAVLYVALAASGLACVPLARHGRGGGREVFA